MELISIDSGEESLPSPKGDYTSTIVYEVYRDAGLLNGAEMVLMTRDLFIGFIEEVRKARRLNAVLQEIALPPMLVLPAGGHDDPE